MNQQTWFAIQHEPSGFFLPEYGSLKGKRGHTHHDPTDKKPPRLFRLRRHAETALKWWLKGKHEIRYSYDSLTDDGGYPHTEHQDDRYADEMQIVEMVIVHANAYRKLVNSESSLWHKAHPEQMGR